MRKTECSIGDLWIFPQPVDFLARNLKITWTQKDLKEKENIKRKDRRKRLEERESDLSKEERGGKKLLLLPLDFHLWWWLPFRVFIFSMQN